MTTPILALPEWSASQASPWVPVNTALRRVEAFNSIIVVQDITLTAPPGGESDGEVWFVAATATGAWAGHDGDLALYTGSSWEFQTPLEGWLLYNLDDSTAYQVESGGTLVEFSSGVTLYAFNNQVGTTYTAVLSDGENTVISLNNAAPITFTVPPNSSVAYPVGTEMTIWQKGAGQVTVAPGSGVTINLPVGGTLNLRGQGSYASLIKTDTDTWSIIGDLEPTGTVAAAEDISYDPSSSGLTATDVQAAIDEVVASLGTAAFVDYETGTYTPALSFATVGDLVIGYTQQVGQYTKIGNEVFVNSRVTLSSLAYTTSSGNLRGTGLPFTVVGTSQQIPAWCFNNSLIMALDARSLQHCPSMVQLTLSLMLQVQQLQGIQ